MSQSITPQRVLELKEEARQLKLTTGIKQTAALAQLAHREGFSSWEVLMCQAGGRDAVDEVKHDAPPTEATVSRAERHAERLRKYGSH